MRRRDGDTDNYITVLNFLYCVNESPMICSCNKIKVNQLIKAEFGIEIDHSQRTTQYHEAAQIHTYVDNWFPQYHDKADWYNLSSSVHPEATKNWIRLTF